MNNSRRAARYGGKLNVAITLRETGELLGGIGLEVPDWDNGHGWTGYWLMPQHWHHGYGVEAASAVCELAFQQLKLHRIDAAVFVFNARSIRLLRKLGFKKEGETREVLYRGGRWHNEYRFGLLASEFRKAQKLA